MKHFIHPGHSLAEVHGSEEFHCDGCKTPGNGLRYRCHTCDFNMHQFCGRCPSTISTFMHPQHHLELMNGTQGRPVNGGFCDLCEDNVEGLFYRCTSCDFDIHPLCTKLPECVLHALHPTHQLTLQKSSSGCCRLCKSECTSWRYGCGICSFDFHLGCILAPCDTSTTSRSIGAPTPPPPPPPWGVYGGLPPYYGPQHPYYSSTAPLYNWPSPTPFSAYAHACAYAPPPPSSFLVPPPSSGFYAQGSGNPSKWRLSKIICAFVENLSVGVLSNLIVAGMTG